MTEQKVTLWGCIVAGLVLLIAGAIIGWHLRPVPAAPEINISSMRDSLATAIRAELKDSIRTITVKKVITIRGVDTVAVLDSTWYWENRSLYALLNAQTIEHRIDTVKIVEPAKQSAWGLGLGTSYHQRGPWMLGPAVRFKNLTLSPQVGAQNGIVWGGTGIFEIR